MNQTLERLKDIETNGYQVDFANVFNHAFENYKKIALYAGLVLFVFMVLFAILIAGSLVSVIGVTAMTQELNPEKLKIENFSENTLLILGVISIFVGSILAPFNASFLKMADCGDKDEEFHISNLFSYYKLPYLTEIFIATLLISAISFGLANLLSLVKLSFLGTLIQWFISFVTILTIPLIIFGNLKAFDAIKYSIQIIFKQPTVLLGLMVVAIIASFVGVMACCIGVFFTLPFLFSMNYAIYTAIVGIDEKDDFENN
jgi:MFS family permease